MNRNPGEELAFTDKAIWQMSLPLFFEQGLVMLMGMVDIAIISYVGSAAISGVSLVNQFNIIFVYLFVTLASGGAVVISQYLGRRALEDASRAGGQLVMFSAALGIACMLAVLLNVEMVLTILFGRVESDVMQACTTYLRITALGYPALAIYNAGAAMFRSMGRTCTTMYVSIAANVLNVAGNIVGVFVLHAGIAGVAYPSLLSICFSALFITWMAFERRNEVYYCAGNIFAFDRAMQLRILRVAVPNSLQQGVAQLVKVALTSIIALFGTVQIAAYGVAQSIWSIAALVGVAVRPVFITVIGQCMGADDIGAADYYFRRLMKMTLIASSLWNLLILLATPLLLNLYQLETAVVQWVLWLVLLNNIFNAFAFPFSSGLGTGLRATGDVKFTMYTAIASTLGVRLLFSYILGIGLGWGVLGIAVAMVADWCVCGLVFYLRERAGQWKLCHVI